MSDFIHITFDIEYDAITYVCIIISLIENEIFMIDYSKAENIKFQKLIQLPHNIYISL